MTRLVTTLLLVGASTSCGSRDRMILAGSFHSVAHIGAGEAHVWQRADGSRYLRLFNVEKYDTPGLLVCLVKAPDARDNDTVRNAGFTCVGELRDRAEYAIPSSVDLSSHLAVTVWNTQYGVNFATAPLEPAPPVAGPRMRKTTIPTSLRAPEIADPPAGGRTPDRH